VSGGPRVLVCDDEPQILRALTILLSESGFDVVAAATAGEALDRAAVQPPDAAIIDLLLPDGDGVEVCRGLRQWSQMPILVLSALDLEQEKIRALKVGADDYVTKPFASGELVARLEAMLRRAAPASGEPVIDAGGLEIDLAARSVRAEGQEVRLTPIEYDLLCVLARNHGKLMTHRALLTEIWGSRYETDTPTLRFHVSNLRKKIEPRGQREHYISTEAGIGYRFRALTRGAGRASPASVNS
jgi:two-component system, OmpR family, KDP operon response regulator KdpE